MSAYFILFAIVLGVNLLPAFGPPTWTIIVAYGLSSHMPLAALVTIGAVASALGRFSLAHAFRALRAHIPAKTVRNLSAAEKALDRRKHHSLFALGLFALSPLPSAQLFEAAGLIEVGLVKFTAAFFCRTAGLLRNLWRHREGHRRHDNRGSLSPRAGQSVGNCAANCHDRAAGRA